MATHEVILELNSGSQVLVGAELATVADANALAVRWRLLAEQQPDALHETAPGSGLMVRASAIVAIKAQPTPKPLAGGLIKAQRDGRWL